MKKKMLFTFKGRSFFSKTNVGWASTDLSGKEKRSFVITVLVIALLNQFSKCCAITHRTLSFGNKGRKYRAAMMYSTVRK